VSDKLSACLLDVNIQRLADYWLKPGYYYTYTVTIITVINLLYTEYTAVNCESR